MPMDASECPICHSKVTLVDLERHVNDHLDKEELCRDQELALNLASSHSSNIKHSAGAIVEQSFANSMSKKGVKSYANSTCNATNYSKDVLQEKCPYSHILDTPEVKAMLASQITASSVEVREGVVSLLRKCLEAENQGISHFALCGYVDHFQSQDGEDVGWGCGWRNIQMLSSNLLSEDPNAKATLFGGAGYVPNIEALQQWLEIAWAKGFDPPGADHFGWKIYGTTKWIGTTECASLFRSFGLRARIFDFMTGHCGPRVDNQSPSNSKHHSGHSYGNVLQSINQNCLSSDAVHWNVQCDNCGVYPIHGPRFMSKNREDYDLCALCVSHQSNSLGTEEFLLDYVRIEKPAETTQWRASKGSERNESGPHKQKKSKSSHQELINWVWQYFTASNGSKSPNAVDHPTQSLTKSKRPPLYFQHQGHSRTIVGIQRRRKSPGAPEEVFLLVLDPSQKTEDLSRALKGNRGWQRLVKRGVHTLHKAEYQLCYVDPGIADSTEFEQLKTISSVPYHY